MSFFISISVEAPYHQYDCHVVYDTKDGSKEFSTFSAMRNIARFINAGPLWIPLLFTSIFLFGMLCHGQQISLNLKQYGKAKGLSDHRVRKSLIHSNGFVYLSTWNGFNRFDGYQCIEIPLPVHNCVQSVFPKNYVYDLFELQDGRIVVFLDDPWESTCEFFLYNPVSGVFSSHKLDAIDQDWQWIETDEKRFFLKESVNRWVRQDFNTIYDQNGNSIAWNIDREKPFAELRLKGKKPEDITYFLKDIVKLGPFPVGRDFSEYFLLISHNGLFKVDVQVDEMKKYLSEGIEDWEYGINA
ncbi:MAG: hypothetical protein WBG42_09260, partial [Cryomorphaceae bacterium]